MHSEYYDIIIIGGGIAGLYSALKIKNYNLNKRFLILEKNSKKYLGGRVGNDKFYNTKIVTGAGIGRKKKDKLLLSLLRYFNFPIITNNVKPNYSLKLNVLDVNNIMKQLKNEYIKNNKPSTTFKQFALKYLGYEKYKDFILSAGYTDFENEDVYETLYHYGMDDNSCCWESFSVPWSDLINSLYREIGESHFLFNNEVKKIEYNIDKKDNSSYIYNYKVITNKNITGYKCNKIIVATEIKTLQKIFNLPIYREICSQPFLRLYSKFSQKSIPILKEYVKGYTFLPGPLQKIIPMNPDNGVYMLAYNDNKNTEKVIKILEYKNNVKKYLANLLKKSLDIPDIEEIKIDALKVYFWEQGTHFYLPLDKKKFISREKFIYQSQHPYNNIIVVGEVVSRNQGWVEGALESVKEVLTKTWLNL